MFIISIVQWYWGEVETNTGAPVNSTPRETGPQTLQLFPVALGRVRDGQAEPDDGVFEGCGGYGSVCSGHQGGRIRGKGQGGGAGPHPVGQEEAERGEGRRGPEPFM